MIEKKLILCGILAIAIGIATIVPLEYMMAAQTQVNARNSLLTHGLTSMSPTSTSTFNKAAQTTQ